MAGREEQDVSTTNGDRRSGIKRNFIMICLAYVCAYTSLNAVISLQSSVNAEANVGLYSLAVLYGSSLVTSLFLTTPLGHIFGYKWSIVAGQLGAMVYVASNVYPKQWLMFSSKYSKHSNRQRWTPCIFCSAAVICGIFRACMFMAQEAYVSVLAGGEGDSENTEENDTKNRKYFSIFFSAYQSGECVVIHGWS